MRSLDSLIEHLEFMVQNYEAAADSFKGDGSCLEDTYLNLAVESISWIDDLKKLMAREESRVAT